MKNRGISLKFDIIEFLKFRKNLKNTEFRQKSQKITKTKNS